MNESQLNLFPPNYNQVQTTYSNLPGVNPQEDTVRQIKLISKAFPYFKDWIDRKHGTADELVNDLTTAFGSTIRMHIIELICRFREGSTLTNIHADYIDTNLSLEAIEIAIQGKRKKQRLHDSTLDELFSRISESRDSKKFIEIVNFVSKFKDYAPYNNMMVYLQRPTAKYWATEKDWNKRFDRRRKEDAIPLIILRPMGPIMLVYEIEDTIGPELPDDLLNPFRVEGEFNPDDLDYLVHECLKDKISVHGATLRGFLAGRAVRITKEKKPILFIQLNKSHQNKEQFATLCHEIAHIYLGHLGGDPDNKWPSRMGLNRSQRELEAESVAYIVCRRRNLITLSADYLAGYWAKPVDRENISVEMIMKVAGRIEQKLPKGQKVKSLKTDIIKSQTPAIQPRILIVDDDETLVSHCGNYFRKEGYDTHTALNAEDALEFLSKKSVDVVITGIVMPGMDGLALTKIIKKKYDTEVIILTGGGSTDRNKEEARKLGAYEFITKPCRLTVLLLNVKKARKSRSLKS